MCCQNLIPEKNRTQHKASVFHIHLIKQSTACLLYFLEQSRGKKVETASKNKKYLVG